MGNNHRVLMIGPQGVGKSVQGKLLQGFLQVPYISSGDVMRQKAKEASSEGNQIKNLLESGQLVPDELTANFIKTRVDRRDCQNGFVIDGYPRTLNQINLFDPDFTEAIFLEASDEIVTRRLLNRNREDDTPELIAQRLEIYHQLTEPLVLYYKGKQILHIVDGTKTIEEIQKQIRKIFE